MTKLSQHQQLSQSHCRQTMHRAAKSHRSLAALVPPSTLAPRVPSLPQKICAQGRNRTNHTWIFSPLLYRLSYLGIAVLGLRALRARSLRAARI